MGVGLGRGIVRKLASVRPRMQPFLLALMYRFDEMLHRSFSRDLIKGLFVALIKRLCREGTEASLSLSLSGAGLFAGSDFCELQPACGSPRFPDRLRHISTVCES